MRISANVARGILGALSFPALPIYLVKGTISRLSNSSSRTASMIKE